MQMVCHNMGLPDPQDPDTSFSSSSDIIMHNEDDNIEDLDDNYDNRYEGYHQLNGLDNIPANGSDTDTEEEEHKDNECMDRSNEPQSSHGGDLPPIDKVEKALLKEVWSDSKSKDIEMDSDKVREVKNAMLNFTLPATSIPDWARNIPEQEWKDHMMQKIQQKGVK